MSSGIKDEQNHFLFLTSDSAPHAIVGFTGSTSIATSANHVVPKVTRNIDTAMHANDARNLSGSTATSKAPHRVVDYYCYYSPIKLAYVCVCVR